MTLRDFLTQDPDGYLHLTGHRIGLQDIVFYYREGYSPEMLLAEFPTLNLSLIHKVLGFYLESQGEVDAYVARCDAEVEQQRAVSSCRRILVQSGSRELSNLESAAGGGECP